MSDKFLNSTGLTALRNWIVQKLGLKQDTLVSGTNVKTINNESILGSGNLTVNGGLQNLVDGSTTGSVRGVGTSSGSSSYTIGYYAFAEGVGTTASGDSSHAEGRDTTAGGYASHAEGRGTIASAITSHAEGKDTTASGYHSHAEGEYTTASGNYSHTEGEYTTASGSCSHTEGYRTTASGNYSHAQNRYTIAAYYDQTAIGKFNDNQSDTAFEIGNGGNTSSRSNAFTVDWDGNTVMQGRATTADMTDSEVEDFFNNIQKGVSFLDIGQKNADFIAENLTQTLTLAEGWTGDVKYDIFNELVIIYFNIEYNSVISSDIRIDGAPLGSNYCPLTEEREYARSISNVQFSVDSNGQIFLLVNGTTISAGLSIKGEVAYFV